MKGSVLFSHAAATEITARQPTMTRINWSSEMLACASRLNVQFVCRESYALKHRNAGCVSMNVASRIIQNAARSQSHRSRSFLLGCPGSGYADTRLSYCPAHHQMARAASASTARAVDHQWPARENRGGSRCDCRRGRTHFRIATILGTLASGAGEVAGGSVRRLRTFNDERKTTSRRPAAHGRQP